MQCASHSTLMATVQVHTILKNPMACNDCSEHLEGTAVKYPQISVQARWPSPDPCSCPSMSPQPLVLPAIPPCALPESQHCSTPLQGPPASGSDDLPPGSPLVIPSPFPVPPVGLGPGLSVFRCASLSASRPCRTAPALMDLSPAPGEQGCLVRLGPQHQKDAGADVPSGLRSSDERIRTKRNAV